MKILTILGSPRKKGNTAIILKEFEALASVKHTVERINITDVEVRGCLGCDHCQKSMDKPGCRQRDDAVAIFERIQAVDVVVYASPVYVWGFTAQLKALLDRHYCLVKWANGEKASVLLQGKPAMLLLTCGGDRPSNADLVQAAFEREIDYLQATNLGTFVAENCTTPRELGQRAHQIANEMIWAIPAK
jgi:multimeric flavodoxin WrbA